MAHRIRPLAKALVFVTVGGLMQSVIASDTLGWLILLTVFGIFAVDWKAFLSGRPLSLWAPVTLGFTEVPTKTNRVTEVTKHVRLRKWVRLTFPLGNVPRVIFV